MLIGESDCQLYVFPSICNDIKDTEGKRVHKSTNTFAIYYFRLFETKSEIWQLF